MGRLYTVTLVGNAAVSMLTESTVEADSAEEAQEIALRGVKSDPSYKIWRGAKKPRVPTTDSIQVTCVQED